MVGGLGRLKEYIQTEVVPFKSDADLMVRGILAVSAPGCGKSLSMKAIGAYLGWPVLRMDVGALKASLVGQSEANMREALRLASAVAPCILGLDELEKGIGGYASSAATDSGVTLGMLGTLLTWMQENRSPVLVFGTVNDYAKLPVELTRRFDETWFLDLPTAAERKEIAEIHFMRVKCRYDAACLDALVESTSGFTGGEVQKLVLSVARRGGRNSRPSLLIELASQIKPIAQSRAAEVHKLREWGLSSLRVANSEDDQGQPTMRLRRMLKSGEQDHDPKR
jgi:SpoVK/Ycf46/Vps4 family AAA+-type ATPase